jgi:hypothetical protein
VTKRKSESESEIAMCDRMQMYNIQVDILATRVILVNMSLPEDGRTIDTCSSLSSIK